MSRRGWLIALWLYAAAGLGDAALHLREENEAGLARYAPDRLIVAGVAGLFWPVDIVARTLLPTG